MPDEVLNIKRVAALLRSAEQTVYAMAQADWIPGFKIRVRWRGSPTEPTIGSTLSRAVAAWRRDGDE